MFTPSELEGEVDHSFFDSNDDGEGNVGKKTTKKDMKADKKIPNPDRRETVKHSEHLAVASSPGAETRRQVKQGENNKTGQTFHASSASFVPNDPIHEGDNELNLISKRPSGSFLALLADMPMKEDNQRPNETKKSALAFTENSKETNEQSSRKLVENLHPKYPVPTSNEANTDADSESSCSSQRGNFSSSNLAKPTKSALRRKARRTRRGSAESQDLPNKTSTDESDGSVTDVSPLSSPDTSSIQSLSSEAEKDSQEVQQEQEMVPSSGFSNIHQEEDSNPDVDECSLGLESQFEQKLVLCCPGGMVRKNYSFSNDEVRRIDRENQRLFRQLSRLSSRPRWGDMASQPTNMSNRSPVTRLAHNALNRQREQRRIEQQNLAFLKKLQSIKATPGLGRSEQLADHQRLMSYPSCRRATSSTSRSSSRASSALKGPRSVSSRAALTNTDSSSTPFPRSSKPSASSPS